MTTPDRSSNIGDPTPAAGSPARPRGGKPAGPESIAIKPDQAGSFDAQRKLRELSVLHEFAKLLTTARDWDELMRTIVDRTTSALDV